MADKKITELTELTSASLNDIFAVVDIAGSETKKITNESYITNVRNHESPLTASGVVISDNLIPKFPSGSSLGSADKPFAELYLQSGSINIESDTPGDPSAVISNVSGNLEISVGGMLLVEPGNSFIADTGSFKYLSGSLEHIGTLIRSGSTDISGSLTASLTNEHVWIGDENNRSTEISLDTLAASGSLIKKSYGSFYDTTSQTASLADTIYAVNHNTTDLSNGVSIVSGTRITISETGIYTIISTHQYVHSTGGVVTITGWLRKNGVDVDYSGTDLRLKGNGDKDLYAINYFVEAEAGDYYELMWSANGTDTYIVATPARTGPVRPAVPSVITTVNKVG
jgi:hypothetical protein